jgi:transcriptional regulator with XRE-family HTH domain/tetratricopeptide (TPR) repeat protein
MQPETDAQIIKEFRTKRSLTQADLAKLLGKNVATINRWEQGHHKPPASVMEKIKQLDWEIPSIIHWPIILKGCKAEILRLDTKEQIMVLEKILKICAKNKPREADAVFLHKDKKGLKYFKLKIHGGRRLVFQGPIRLPGKDARTAYTFDFFGSHRKYIDYLKSKGGTNLEKKIEGYIKNTLSGDEYPPKVVSWLDSLLKDEDGMLPYKEADFRFGWKVPLPLQANPAAIQRAMEDDNVAISLTQEQSEIVESSLRPVLVHGPAGSGKSTILYHRLAMSLISISDGRHFDTTPRICFTSYSPSLVATAKKRTQSILEKHHLRSDIGVEKNVEFLPFMDLLMQIIPNKDKFLPKQRVSFSKFRTWFQDGFGRNMKMTTELAWHIIRSIIKGRITNEKDSIDMGIYDSLPRKARDVTKGQFKKILEKLWPKYLKWMREKGQWDDQDLALEVLTIINEIDEIGKWKPPYSEMFVDEAQDLTMIEYHILLQVCGDGGSGEGVALTLAGDPLQTINPTGFRWGATKAVIYESAATKKPVDLKVLRENWRSDFRIVAFNNSIQAARSFHMEEKMNRSEIAMKTDGSGPKVIPLTEKVKKSVKSLLSNDNIPAKSAIIVWPEDQNDVEDFLKENQDYIDLKNQGYDLDVYSINDSKGMEYRLVILFRIGSHPKVKKWLKNIVKNEKGEYIAIGKESNDLIPLLYFLNRFYVGGTRAMDYLIILDDESAVEKFWKPLNGIWRDENDESHQFLDFAMNEEEITEVFESEIFNTSLYATPEQKKKWARDLFDKAREQGSVTLMTRARRQFKNITDSSVDQEKCNAYIEMWEGNYQKAATHFENIGDKRTAVNCFENSGSIEEAIRLLETMGHENNMEIMAWHAKLKFSLMKKLGDGLEGAKFIHDICCSMGNTDSRLNSLQSEAGKILFDCGEYERALDLFEMRGDIMMQGRCNIKRKQWERGLELLNQSGVSKDDSDYILADSEIKWPKTKTETEKVGIISKLHGTASHNSRIIEWCDSVLSSLIGMVKMKVTIIKGEALLNIGNTKEGKIILNHQKPFLKNQVDYDEAQIGNYSRDIKRKEEEKMDAEEDGDTDEVSNIEETIADFKEKRESHQSNLNEINELFNRLVNVLTKLEEKEDPMAAIGGLISAKKYQQAKDLAKEKNIELPEKTLMEMKIQSYLDDKEYSKAFKEALKSGNIDLIDMVFKTAKSVGEKELCLKYIKPRNKILKQNDITPSSKEDSLADFTLSLEFDSAVENNNFTEMLKISGLFQNKKDIEKYLDKTASLMSTIKDGTQIPMKYLAIITKNLDKEIKASRMKLPAHDLCYSILKIINSDHDSYWINSSEAKVVLNFLKKIMTKGQGREIRTLFLTCGDEEEANSWARRTWIQMMTEFRDFRKENGKSIKHLDKDMNSQVKTWRRRGWK